MRLCTFRSNGETKLGAESPRGIVDLRAVDSGLPATLLELCDSGLDRARRALEDIYVFVNDKPSAAARESLYLWSTRVSKRRASSF